MIYYPIGVFSMAVKKSASVKKSAAKKSAPVKKAVAKKVVEKKTGERYASKAAMVKHEKGEGPAMRMKEYGPMGKEPGKKVAKKSAKRGK